MNQFNLRDAFCEVLSGFALMIILIPLLCFADISMRLIYIVNYCSLSDLLSYICSKASLANVGLFITLSYVLGLIVDAIGLTIGELFLDGLLSKSRPSESERKTFWKNANSHVLRYRDAQWAYYSVYRNLFILFMPGTVFWTIYFWKKAWYFGIINLLVLVIFEVVLLYSMKVLLDLYHKITKSA